MYVKTTLIILLLVVLPVSVMAYLVRPGDVLSISVYGSADLSSEITVGPDGTAAIPPLGGVQVLGKSLEEIQTLLSSKYLSQGILATKPQVTVSVKSYAPFMFYILGEVNKPGAIEWKRNDIGVTQLIALAGGLKDGADLSSAFLIKENGKREYVDLTSILSGGSAVSLTLSEGASLLVPAGAKAWIRTIGEFRSPVLLRFNPGLTLTQVIAQSGGLTERADKSELILISDTLENGKASFNLNEILAGRSADPEIPAGSIVAASDSSKRSVKLLGELNNPAAITFRDGLTLLQAIGEVGGVKSSAGDEIFILSQGAVEPVAIKVNDLLKGEAKDVPLRSGDTVFVPRESERYVYIASATFGGKVVFSEDEKLTLANALVKVDLYDPSNAEPISLVGPAGNRVQVDRTGEVQLEIGSMIIVPQSEKSVYIAGEVNQPGSIKFENFNEVTLSKVIARAGGYTDKAGGLEIMTKEGDKFSLPIEEGLRSNLKLSSQSIVYVNKIEPRYVYVVAPELGGRVDFAQGEAFTVKNLLAKLNMLKFNVKNAAKKIEILEPSGASRPVTAATAMESDVQLLTGSIVVIPDMSAWIYVFGEVNDPGKLELYEEDLLLTRAISASGGYTAVADISAIQILSGGESREVDLHEILKGSENDRKLEFDDLIYIPRLDSRFVYVLSQSAGGKVEFASGEKMTLRNALAKLNLVDTASGKFVRFIDPAGERTEVALSSLESVDYELVSGTVIFYPNAYNTVFVLGEVRKPGTVTLQPDAPFTLANVLAAAGGMTEFADRQAIAVISTDNATTVVYSADNVSSETLPSLTDGVTVYVPERPARYVYVIGGVKNPGLKVLERDDPSLTLTKAIALSGGLLDPNSEAVEIVENSQRRKLNLQNLLNGTLPDIEIAPGSIVHIPQTQGKFVYIVSKHRGGRIDFESGEELSLRTALAKENLLDTNSSGRITIILPDGTKRERLLSDLKENDMSLAVGSIILYPVIQKQLYILGAVKNPGPVLFDPAEKSTITTLVAKAGGTTDQALMKKVQLTDPYGRTNTLDMEPILLGKVLDVKLEDGSLVYVPAYEPITVNVIGQVKNPGVVEFSKTETPSLILAIAKAGGLGEKASKEIKIVGPNSEVDWHRLLEGIDTPLQKGQTVFVLVDDNYVYIAGEVAVPGRYDFSPDEDLTVIKALAKAGGVRETSADELKVIEPSGEVIPIKVSELTAGKVDLPLVSGSTVIAPKGVTKITVLGSVRNPGMYLFNRSESSSIGDVVARAGGLVDSENVERILIQSAGSYVELDVSSLEKRTENLKDGAFVYVATAPDTSVTVLGEVKNPGNYVFSGSKVPTVAHAIARAGGVQKSVSTLNVVTEEGKIKLLDALKTEELTRNYLNDGDTVIAIKNRETYVSVIGDVRGPNVYSLVDQGEVTMAELIAMAGGFNTLERKDKLQIFNNGKVEEVNLGTDEFVALSRKIVEPGSIVFVPYSEPAKVYVFGEVLKPGIVKFSPGMTAVEALIEAGGPTSYAVLGNVLLFKNADEEPLILNLDQQKGNPIKGAVQLMPGNIIYVPQSPIVNIKDIMSIVASSLSIVNSAVGIFK